VFGVSRSELGTSSTFNFTNMSTPNRADQIKSVIRVSSGNFLEMYDFTVFGYYAAQIGATFFAKNDASALLKAFMTFGAGFMMRPLGAIVLGAYLDRKGRRAGLLLTLALMSVGTLSIACMPGYRTIGLLAPIMIVIGRLTQGFSAGVELGGVSVYLSEIATAGHKGFYVSWQSASQQVAVIFASILGMILNARMSPAEMDRWGWRIPLFVGCLIIPMLFALRRTLPETDAFHAQEHHPSARELARILAANWRIVLRGLMLVTMTTVSFYLITAYTPAFGTKVLKLHPGDTLTVTLCVGISNLFWLPVMGALSDRIGRRPILIMCTALMLLSSYPLLHWLVTSASFPHLKAVELWFSFLYASYNGAMVVLLTEIMPTSARTSGFSLAYSLATVIGGFSPAVCTKLIEQSHNKAMPGFWLSCAALCGLLGTVSLRQKLE